MEERFCIPISRRDLLNLAGVLLVDKRIVQQQSNSRMSYHDASICKRNYVSAG